MKIKNLKYSLGILGMATVLSLTGCNGKASVDEENLSTIEYKVEKKYRVSDIKVVKVHNPETERDEYYFLTFSSVSAENEEKAKQYFAIPYKDTKLLQYINSDSAQVCAMTMTYKSVLPDDAFLTYFMSEIIYGELNEYMVFGDYDYYVFTVNNSSYYSNHSKLFDNQTIIDGCNYSYCSIGNEFYSDDKNYKTYGPNIFRLESLGYGADETITESELEEIQKNGLQIEKENNQTETGYQLVK